MYYNFSNIRTLYYICVVESGPKKKKSEFLVRNQMKLELKKERSTLDFYSFFLPWACFTLKKVSPNMAKNEENLYSTTPPKVGRVA